MAISRQQRISELFALFSTKRLLPKEDFYLAIQNIEDAQDPPDAPLLIEDEDIERMHYAMRLIPLTRRYNVKRKQEQNNAATSYLTPNSFNLNIIPNEIWRNEIFSHLSFHDRIQLRSICKKFKLLVDGTPIHDPVIFGNSFVIIPKCFSDKKLVTHQLLIPTLTFIEHETLAIYKSSIMNAMPPAPQLSYFGNMHRGLFLMPVMGVALFSSIGLILALLGGPPGNPAIFWGLTFMSAFTPGAVPMVLMCIALAFLILTVTRFVFESLHYRAEIENALETPAAQERLKTFGFFEHISESKPDTKSEAIEHQFQQNNTLPCSVIIEDVTDNETAMPLQKAR